MGNLPTLNDNESATYRPTRIDIVEKLRYAILRKYLDDGLEYCGSFNKIKNSRKESLPLDHVQLLKIYSLQYRKPEDIKKSLLTLYSIIHAIQRFFIYILRVKQNKVELYLGLYDPSKKEGLIDDVETLQTSLPGVFPGCRLEKLDKDNTKNLLNDLHEFVSRKIITGVPSENEDKQKETKSSEPSLFGIEQLIDSMGEDFCIIVSAKPVEKDELNDFEKLVGVAADITHLLSKQSVQLSESTQDTKSETIGISTTSQEQSTFGSTTGTSNVEQDNISDRFFKGVRFFLSGGRSPKVQTNEQISKQETVGTSDTLSETISRQWGFTVSHAVTVEETNKSTAYLEDVLAQIHKRIADGRGFGMWQTCAIVLSQNKAQCDKASTIYTGILSGPQSHIDPIRSIDVSSNFLPFHLEDMNLIDEHPLGSPYKGLYTYLTTAELALTAGFPFHEVPYFQVQQITEYARSQPDIPKKVKTITIGKMIDHTVMTESPIHISTEQLNRHCFVTGATGSGKSNTMRIILLNLWKELGIPFLVIEPVKSEYRSLKREIPELNVFTLGHQNSRELNLNPFDFEPTVGLVAHIDNLKATFNAALGMYSSMPFILEEMIYRVYEQAGWNLNTGENPMFDQAATIFGQTAPTSLRDLFLPRLEDMLPLVEEAINAFFPKITDYGGSLMGALRSRISSLTRGAKGFLLNERQSASMSELLSTPCIIELFPFADNDEKVLVMALLLIKLYEHRQQQELSGLSEKGLRHLLVIEEAHRLLTKPEGGSEFSGRSKQKGVEVFADILAEIRSYGQGMVIVDQIPSKLVSDVLKNTDVKIAHRLVAQDDRDAVGSCMTLGKEQIRDLARSKPGVATVYFEGLENALRVQVNEFPLEAPEYGPPRNLSAHRRQSCFGWDSKKNDYFENITEQQIKIGMMLVIGIGVIALSSGKETLLELRHDFPRKISSVFNFDLHKKIWPLLSESILLLDNYLRKEIDKNIFTPSFSAYITSVFAYFVKEWLDADTFDKTLHKLKAESVGIGNLYALNIGQPTDLLDLLLKIYISSQGTSFHWEFEQALMSVDQNNEPYWQPLQEKLMAHVTKITLSTQIQPTAKVDLYMRLLSKIKTDDANDKFAELVGKAIGTLKNIAIITKDMD